jgi:hypothetical protein
MRRGRERVAPTRSLARDGAERGRVSPPVGKLDSLCTADCLRALKRDRAERTPKAAPKRSDSRGTEESVSLSDSTDCLSGTVGATLVQCRMAQQQAPPPLWPVNYQDLSDDDDDDGTSSSSDNSQSEQDWDAIIQAGECRNP